MSESKSSEWTKIIVKAHRAAVKEFRKQRDPTTTPLWLLALRKKASKGKGQPPEEAEVSTWRQATKEQDGLS